MNLEEADLAAAALSREYQRLGEVALIIRTHKKAVRLIGPRIEPPLLAEFLKKASDVVFDGPAQAGITGEMYDPNTNKFTR